MMKIVRRLLAALAFFAVIIGALKTLLNWVARSGDDDHEVFADDDLEQV